MDIPKIFNRFRTQKTPAKNMVIETTQGTFDLAKEADKKKFKSIVLELQRQSESLTKSDIAGWRAAWQMALSADNPSRQRLYNIYRDVDIDGHLSGCVTQRKGFVKARSFQLVDKNGVENEDATQLLNSSWFKQLMDYALDSIYWGHSLIQLGDPVTNDEGKRTYSEVTLVPRRHVVPEYHRVTIEPGQDWREGIDYHESPFSEYLIEVGRKDNLGLFLKAALHTIPKKNVSAFWDSFAELFGMPMRIAKTTARDDKERRKIEKMLDQMGTAFWALFSEGTEIELVENSRGDSFNVYDRRIERANSEISKLIVCQTMTVEDGSSLSQSQTHLEIFENLIEDDADMLRDIINDQLLPRMAMHGFPVKGLRFDWDYEEDYTPEQQVAYETMIADRYKVDGKYFADKYGVPAGDALQQQLKGKDGFFD